MAAGELKVSAVFTGKDRLSRITKHIEGRFERFARNASRALGRIDRFSNRLVGSLGKLKLPLLAAGAALGFVAKSVFDAGAGFEQAITNVGAVSLMTRDQIADLEKKALELGATTKFTATEAANGMELMAKAGFTNAEILQGIGGILNAAAAEGAELAETAGHVSNVLKGMGLATSEATRVADVLTLASARTNSSISSLGESMANVSSTARQFNIPLEEAVAAVALLQDIGLDASVSGSAFNTMLTKLAKPTSAIAAKMREFGVSFQDAKGNMLPLGDVMANMAKAAQKSGGNMEQVAFFADLVGLRGQKAATNLKDLFLSGKVGNLVDELNAAVGPAEQMAQLRMDTLTGDITLLGSAVDGVKVALFKAEGGPLRKFVQRMTDWVGKNQDEIVKRIGDAFDAIGRTVDAMRPAVEGFFEAFSAAFNAGKQTKDLKQTFQDFGNWFKDPENQEALREWGTLLGTAASTLLKFGNFVLKYTPEIVTFYLAIKVARGVLVGYEGALLAVAAAKKGIAFAQGLWNGAMFASVVPAGAMNAALVPLLATIGAIAAAIGGLLLAWNQLSKLADEVGGFGGIWEGIKSTFTEGSFFAGADEHMNEQARERARQREQRGKDNANAGQTPHVDNVTAGSINQSIEKNFSENVSRAEVTVRSEPGTKAKVTKPLKSPGAGLRLAPSGADR